MHPVLTVVKPERSRAGETRRDYIKVERRSNLDGTPINRAGGVSDQYKYV